MASDLRGCLGAALAQQGVQAKAIADYFVPLESSISFIVGAGQVTGLRCGEDIYLRRRWTTFGVTSPFTVRNAYSACLLFPQLQGLKFSILLKTVKRSWYKSEPRYASFYDPTSLFCKFASQLLDRTNVESVRFRLILVWRFLGLYRGVDLSRVYRVVSVVNGQGMVAVRRKGRKNVKFEKVLSLTDESVSPWHLLNLYVSLTATHARPGTPLLRALKPPFSPLSADRVNSITKGALT